MFDAKMDRCHMPKYTADQIEEKFDNTAFTLNQERSDFLVPQVVDFVDTKRWINLRPAYQRRFVWDRKKKSRFIESLLLNVPIPPVFLYEWDLNRYEVMDGQQRLDAISTFVKNEFALTGLEEWTELNGLMFSELPNKLQLGLQRRRISANVLLVQSGLSKTGIQTDLRRLIFERLNTGGQSLNPQEIRNCLYDGEFNRMLIGAAANKTFRSIWEITDASIHGKEEELDRASSRGRKLYRRMTDCELVLRFFAFRESKNIKGSVRSILDNFMREKVGVTAAAAAKDRRRFEKVLSTAKKVFGNATFKYRVSGQLKLSQPLYDATMIALDRLEADWKKIIDARSAVRESLEQVLADEDVFGIVVNRPNTAGSIKKRINIIEQAIRTGAQLD